ncbi:hypothetical protein L7F22_022149 [Adiantum nelumboides]|nr:hypothetical protein [Adiantum nelumboides]
MPRLAIPPSPQTTQASGKSGGRTPTMCVCSSSWQGQCALPHGHFPLLSDWNTEKWTKLHHISTSDYLQYESGKFSKSRNIGVFGDKAGTIGVASDVWRFYLLANRRSRVTRCSAGRSLSHATTMSCWQTWAIWSTACSSSSLQSTMALCPPSQTEWVCVLGQHPWTATKLPTRLYARLIRDVNDLLSVYATSMDAVRLRLGLQTAMQISGRGNLFPSEAGLDNSLFDNRRAECDATMLLAVNLIYVLSAVFHPFMRRQAMQFASSSMHRPDCCLSRTVALSMQTSSRRQRRARVHCRHSLPWISYLGTRLASRSSFQAD